MKTTIRIDVKTQLGEGIVWVPPIGLECGFFLSVDIHGRKIFRFNENAEYLQIWDTPERVGWVLPTLAANRFLAGFQSGFANISLSNKLLVENLTPIFPNKPEMRLNDAIVDSEGVVWAGSLNYQDESQPDGSLIRYTPNGEYTVVDTGYCVTNGPAISPNQQLFLHTDSTRRTIYAFDFDVLTSSLSNKRIWKIFTPHEGYPDGMTFDSTGHLWVAHWGTGLVSQFNQVGELLQRGQLPVSNVTNMAFGGVDLNRLFVTSASVGNSIDSLINEPLAGCIFEIENHGATGLFPNFYGKSIRQDD